MLMRRGWSTNIAAIGGSVAAAPFVLDTFTDTAGDLLTTQHTGETGATWAANGASATAQATVSDANRIYNTTSGTLYASGTPADADYSVTGVFYIRSAPASCSVALGLRYSTSALTGYLAGLFATGTGTAEWRLYEITTGTLTLLRSAAQAVSAGQSYTMKFTATGTTLGVLVNGVAPFADITDSTHSGAGVVAIRLNTAMTNTTGYHLDSIQADD